MRGSLRGVSAMLCMTHWARYWPFRNKGTHAPLVRESNYGNYGRKKSRKCELVILFFCTYKLLTKTDQYYLNIKTA